MDLLPAIETQTSRNPEASVIWLHGLGADGNDFAPLARQFELPLATRFVFPHAPMQPVTINGGYVMRAWYDIVEQNLARREDEAGVQKSQRAVDRLIVREIERGIPANRIVLAGFSQGGAIALHTGLRCSQRLAGVLALSAYLPLAQTAAPEFNPVNRALPIFMAHGNYDQVIPLMLAQVSRALLERHGYKIEWRDYAMAHSVCDQEILDINTWLGRVLARVRT